LRKSSYQSILSALTFALKRLYRHRSLVLCLFIGLVLAVALAVEVPLYADGVSYHLLNTALDKAAAEVRQPSFDFVFHYVGAWHTPLEVRQYDPVDQFLQDPVSRLIGLPSSGISRYAATDNLQLYPNGEKIQRSKKLDNVKLAFLSSLLDSDPASPIRLIEGRLPEPVVDITKPVEALAALNLANDLGLQVGLTYILNRPGQASSPAYQQLVTVVGIWTPVDPADNFWFYPPDSFDKKLIIPEETFWGPIAGSLARPVNDAAWRIAFDSSQVHSEDVPRLIRQIEQVQTQVNAILPNTDLETSPVQALRQYYHDSQSLVGLLFIFSVPVLGLALYFLVLVAGMLVRIQRNEIAVLRSRGASRWWVAIIYGTEWSLLGIAALLCGPWLGVAFAQLVGKTQSFLDFSSQTTLIMRLTPRVIGFGIAVVALAILFSMLPVWQASRSTIVSYKQERARSSRKPLWQRMYLDLLLFIPTLYGLYTLRAQGSLQSLGRSAVTNNPFENPLLFLLPTLFIIASGLLLLRVIPLIFDGLAWLAARLPSTVPVLALRQLARSTGDHLGPLMLLIITLSLAGFVASMAHTLDRHLVDEVYYEIGADINLVEGGEYTGDAPTGSQAAGISSSEDIPVWNFLPVTDHLTLPGVQAAARVGRFDAALKAAGRTANGRLVGLDRIDFPAVAFYRSDFASEPVVSLMNRLAYDPAALLVDRRTWESFHLNIGDTIPVDIKLPFGEIQPMSFKVAGMLDYFPTLYPEDGPVFVANLEYIFEVAGGLQPYDVWLKTAPGADTQAIIQGINNLGVPVVRSQEARKTLAQVLAAPNRQGVLGLLSVGFLAAALLTVIGFLLYAIFSFRERFVQLGVLRAIGLSTRQMAAALVVEQSLVLLVGLAAGTVIAVWTAYLFIPYLPVMSGSHPGVPPYLVEIAWDDIMRVYLIFGVMLISGIGLTIWSLTRMKIFQAVKLGEIV
jgi:putative ABC transport system permease protein